MGASLSQVFFQEISCAKKSDLYRLANQFVLKASLLSVPIFLLIYFFAHDIFIFVFGKEWSVAGEAASILAPWLFLNFLSAPLGNILIVLNKQEVVLFVSLLYMFVPIVLLFWLYSYGFLHVLQWITIAMSLILLIYIGLIYFYLYGEKSAL